jgi:hypothetical protein
MKHEIRLRRVYETIIIVDASDEEQAIKNVGGMDGLYRMEMEQVNVIDERLDIDCKERICSKTGEVMSEGWVVNDGEDYYKYESDAHERVAQSGYENYMDAFLDDFIYWTTFD